MVRHIYIAGGAVLALIGLLAIAGALAFPAESKWPTILRTGDRDDRLWVLRRVRHRRIASHELHQAILGCVEPDQHKLVRDSAVLALCAVDPEGSVPVLLRLLENDPPYGTYATIMLELIPLHDPEDRVAQLVVPWVTSEDPVLRGKAFSCIRFLGGRAKAAKAALTRFVLDPSNPSRERHDAARGLLALLVDAHASAAAAERDDPKAFRVVFGVLGEDDIPNVWYHAVSDVQRYGRQGGAR